MQPKIIIDEQLLRQIFQQESIKVIGVCMKRFEIPLEIKKKNNQKLELNEEEIENLKLQLKNVIYESIRDIRDILIINGKESFHLTKKEKTDGK